VGHPPVASPHQPQESDASRSRRASRRRGGEHHELVLGGKVRCFRQNIFLARLVSVGLFSLDRSSFPRRGSLQRVVFLRISIAPTSGIYDPSVRRNISESFGQHVGGRYETQQRPTHVLYDEGPRNLTRRVGGCGAWCSCEGHPRRPVSHIPNVARVLVRHCGVVASCMVIEARSEAEGNAGTSMISKSQEETEVSWRLEEWCLEASV
jgi:hypothetical protein